MKKVFILFLTLLSILIMNISASAAEVTYQNLITDQTTVEEDFVTLGMDINDYYYPETYEYDKFYIVAMSESYINNGNTIQTYFYMYNPTRLSNVPELTITYNGTNTCYLNVLSYDRTHGVIKTKGFSYSYVKDYEIIVTNIKSTLYIEDEDSIESDPISIEVTRNDSTGFSAKNSHSKLNNEFGIELNYDSMIVIEECNVVEVEIYPDDNFANWWESIWSRTDTSMLVYFYNFNFPDHIEYDSVEYAKFEYDYNNHYEKVVIYDDFYHTHQNESNLTTEHVISEYNNDSKTLRVNKNSVELNFPTFYLGNRFDDPNFALKDNVNSGDIDFFDMDVSVLLDSTYKTVKTTDHIVDVIYLSWMYKETTYTSLDEVELIELHYQNDGVLYKCQVVSSPVDEEDFGHVDSQPLPEESFWSLFVSWFTTNFPYSILLLIILVMGGVLSIVFFPYIVQFSIFIIKTIIRILALPIEIIRSFFRRE